LKDPAPTAVSTMSILGCEPAIRADADKKIVNKATVKILVFNFMSPLRLKLN